MLYHPPAIASIRQPYAVFSSSPSSDFLVLSLCLRVFSWTGGGAGGGWWRNAHGRCLSSGVSLLVDVLLPWKLRHMKATVNPLDGMVNVTGFPTLTYIRHGKSGVYSFQFSPWIHYKTF